MSQCTDDCQTAYRIELNQALAAYDVEVENCNGDAQCLLIAAEHLQTRFTHAETVLKECIANCPDA